ncbi:MAG: MBL fold metallo-hydrolase [Candidatus Fimivivens sp.]
MQTAIFHTVNSGLYFWDGKTGILVDGLHGGANIGFSDMPPEICKQLDEKSGFFSHLDGILFTHFHPDHFDRKKLLSAIQSPTPPLVYGPSLPETTVASHRIFSDTWLFRVGDVHVLSTKTCHDGERFKNALHHSLLLRFGQESFFIAGDALLQESRADLLINFFNAPITAAFINVYQAFSKECFDFMRKLQPQRIFLYHLPFERDDTFDYFSLAQRALKRFPTDLPKLELLEQMQWLDRCVGDWCEAGDVDNRRVLPPQPKGAESSFTHVSL